MKSLVRTVLVAVSAALFTLGGLPATDSAAPRPGAALASTIEERVKKVIVEQLGVKQEEVLNAASLVDDLGADEEDMVELVMALEEEFDTEISDEQAAELTTVQAILDFITGSRP